MQKSYEEIYAEIYGSDFIVDVKNKAQQLLQEEEDMNTPLLMEKPLDHSIITAEFVEYNRPELVTYVLERVATIQDLLKRNLHTLSSDPTTSITRKFIYCLLKQIEAVHPYVVDEIDEQSLDIIGRAQELFIKRMHV